MQFTYKNLSGYPLSIINIGVVEAGANITSLVALNHPQLQLVTPEPKEPAKAHK